MAADLILQYVTFCRLGRNAVKALRICCLEMGATCSVCGSNPEIAADHVVPADDDNDVNASRVGVFSDLAESLQGMAVALFPELDKTSLDALDVINGPPISYDTRKCFWGGDGPHFRQVQYATQCPKGHPLILADSRPKIAVLSLQGAPSPRMEQLDPLQLKMPSNYSAQKIADACLIPEMTANSVAPADDDGIKAAHVGVFAITDLAGSLQGMAAALLHASEETSKTKLSILPKDEHTVLHCRVCMDSTSSSNCPGWFTCSVENCCNLYAVCVECMEILNVNAADDAEIKNGRVSPNPGIASQIALTTFVESTKSGFTFSTKVRAKCMKLCLFVIGNSNMCNRESDWNFFGPSSHSTLFCVVI